MIGIAAGNVDGADVTMRNIIISGNTIVAGRALHQHSWIIASGNPDRYAYNIVIADNIVDGYGIVGNDTAGAIHLLETAGVSVTGNAVENFAEAGIVFKHHNTSFLCSNNLVSSGVSAVQPYGISVVEVVNTGFIVGNRLNDLPIFVRDDPTNDVIVGDNDT